jgi:predicted AlkP superfamily pyrophosphatase or phosphodiesterase
MLTVVMVIDQLAYYEIEKVKQFLTGGIKIMRNSGINYENAQFDHWVPETATGHTTLSTGASPKDHGIIGNSWVNENGIKISSDDDTAQRAAVFAKQGMYNFGKSAHYVMVDALSDQFMLWQQPNSKRAAIALSHKSRAATALASKMGKAFWFDVKNGRFTSSKAYVPTLPGWITNFNDVKNIEQLTQITWPLMYAKNSAAYAFTNINNYDYSGSWGFNTKSFKTLAGTQIPLRQELSGEGDDDEYKGRFELFAKSPAGNQLLIDCAKACLDEYIDRQKIDQMLLWVSCSSLDKTAHPFGPDSLEAIDLIYHIDKQLADLMSYAEQKVGAQNVLFVLTADHGTMHIPELVHDMGYTSARRIYTAPLIKKMNELIEKKYNVASLITSFHPSQFYFDKAIFKSLDKKTQRAIYKDLKKYLEHHPGIKRVWTYKEMEKSNYHLGVNELEAFCKNQIFKGRSGDLICQTYPYCLLTDHPRGASHSTPYLYDTHVPLMIYRKGTLENKKILNHVWMQQMTVSLAHLMKIPCPSASTFHLLPGLY